MLVSQLLNLCEINSTNINNYLRYTLKDVKPNLDDEERIDSSWVESSFDIESTIDSNGKKRDMVHVHRITGYEL